MTTPSRTPRDVAVRSREALDRAKRPDSFKRETFVLSRPDARAKARDMFARYPAAGYGTVIESWSVKPGNMIEFTVRRLPSAD